MKKSKYILSILLTLAFVFTAACGTSSSTGDDEDIDLEADVDVAAEDSENVTEADELDEELLEDSDDSEGSEEQAAVDEAGDAAMDVADSDIPEDIAFNEAADPEAPGSFPDTSLDSVPDPSAPADHFAEASTGGFSSGAGSGEYETYSIQKGDTLMKIAFKVYGDLTRWREIYSQNQAKIPNPNMLIAGKEISYERPSNDFRRDTSGRSYLIQQGDTLGSIALDIYSKVSKWRKIWDRNKDLIRDPNKIYAGFLLYYDISAQELAEADSRRDNMNQDAQNQMGQDQFAEGEPQLMEEPPLMEEPEQLQAVENPPQANNELPQEITADEDEFGEIRLPAAE